MYYLCSENKGADKLCSNCAADLCRCVCICIIWFSHDTARMIQRKVATDEQIECVLDEFERYAVTVFYENICYG